MKIGSSRKIFSVVFLSAALVQSFFSTLHAADEPLAKFASRTISVCSCEELLNQVHCTKKIIGEKNIFYRGQLADSFVNDLYEHYKKNPEGLLAVFPALASDPNSVPILKHVGIYPVSYREEGNSYFSLLFRAHDATEAYEVIKRFFLPGQIDSVQLKMDLLNAHAESSPERDSSIESLYGSSYKDRFGDRNYSLNMGLFKYRERLQYFFERAQQENSPQSVIQRLADYFDIDVDYFPQVNDLDPLPVSDGSYIVTIGYHHNPLPDYAIAPYLQGVFQRNKLFKQIYDGEKVVGLELMKFTSDIILHQEWFDKKYSKIFSEMFEKKINELDQQQRLDVEKEAQREKQIETERLVMLKKAEAEKGARRAKLLVSDFWMNMNAYLHPEVYTKIIRYISDNQSSQTVAKPIALLGQSGMGKSTLIEQVLAGLRKKLGHVRPLMINLQDYPNESALVEYLKHQVKHLMKARLDLSSEKSVKSILKKISAYNSDPKNEADLKLVLFIDNADQWIELENDQMIQSPKKRAWYDFFGEKTLYEIHQDLMGEYKALPRVLIYTGQNETLMLKNFDRFQEKTDLVVLSRIDFSVYEMNLNPERVSAELRKKIYQATQGRANLMVELIDALNAAYPTGVLSEAMLSDVLKKK